MQQAISTRFDSDIILRINELATHQERSRSEVIKDAVDCYLQYMTWYGEEIQKGRADVSAGRVVEADHVKARMMELGLNVD